VTLHLESLELEVSVYSQPPLRCEEYGPIVDPTIGLEASVGGSILRVGFKLKLDSAEELAAAILSAVRDARALPVRELWRLRPPEPPAGQVDQPEDGGAR
jgi:hypothetical protein